MCIQVSSISLSPPKEDCIFFGDLFQQKTADEIVERSDYQTAFTTACRLSREDRKKTNPF
jgi:hypothetical protein